MGGHRVSHSGSGHRVSSGSFRSSSGSSYRSNSPSRSSSYGGSSYGGSYGGSSYSNRRQSGGGFDGSLWGPGMYMLGRKSAHREMERGGYYGGYGQTGYGGNYRNDPNAYGTGYNDQAGNRQQPQQPGGPQNGQPEGGGKGGCSGCGIALLIFFGFLLLFLIMGAFLDQGGSTVERHKLEGVPKYEEDCVVDEIGVLGDIEVVQEGLKDFYDQTGVQPYVIFKSYDSALSSDATKEDWAKMFFENKLQSQDNAFLVIYFGERPDYGSGFMWEEHGSKANAILDNEAQDLFWGRIDKAWSSYGESGFNNAFVKAYSDTASTIMRVSTTGNDVLRWLLMLLIIAAILFWIFRMRREKNRREKEKAEETERILNTPVEKFGDNSDELIDKYRDKTPEEVEAEKAAAEKAAAAKAAEEKAAAAEQAAEARIKAEMEAAEKAAAAEIAAEKAAAARAEAQAAKKAQMGMADDLPGKEILDADDPMLKTFSESEADDLINKYKDPK